MENYKANGETMELESPFLRLTNFKNPESKPIAQNTTPLRSPFKSVYEINGLGQVYDTEHEALIELMDELYDEEFDEFVQEIANEAQGLYENQLGNTYGAHNKQSIVAQNVTENFTPFLNRVDQFMEHMVGIANQPDAEKMSDEEWDGLVDQYIIEMETSPTIEYWGFFKKIAKKVKKVAKVAKNVVKKGVSIAKKFGFGFIIKKLKKIIFKFLKGVLKKGINKLPRKYRPMAKTLAKKIGILRETSEHEVDAYNQQELDSVITQFLLAPNEIELETIEQEFLNEEEGYIDNSLDQLDAARENFISQISELEEGESPEPVIEEFVTAVLTGVKLAVRIIGKKRVKRIAVNLISKLIRKYVGKRNARRLSKHLVGAGFKLLNLELTPEQEIEEGNRILAEVIENTVRQISELPEHVLEDEALLESNIMHTIEESMGANFPDILTEDMYLKRPDLREASKHKVAWKAKMIGKGRRKKYRYKTLNKEIETELTPYIAQKIKTFGGVPLGNVLRDQMGVIVNRRIPVKVHLFETLPGANRFSIGRHERIIQGLGNPNVAYQLIHPLTSIASGLLMGEPALGCKSKTKCLKFKNSNASHRYYYLEIPGARPQLHSTSSGVQTLRKVTGLKLKLNFIKNQIQLFLYLSETDAQNIASQMRQHMQNNAVRLSTMAIELGLKTAFSRHAIDNIMVVHPNVIPGKSSSMAMQYIPSIIQDKLKVRIKEWVEGNLSNHFMNNDSEFIEAADAKTDGITVCVKMQAPSDFNVMGQLINLKKAQIPENLFAEKNLEMIIKVKPGYHYA